MFVERVLPGSILRKVGEAEMEVYRRPFREPGEGRRPTLTWPRQIPLDGEPADVNEIVGAYAQWLVGSELPKLFIKAEPGAILTGGAVSALLTRMTAPSIEDTEAFKSAKAESEARLEALERELAEEPLRGGRARL